MSFPMFIIPQYPAIILDDWSLPIINLQCWVLLHQLVNIPRKKSIMYRGILNWTSQLARKKCIYYSKVTINELTIPFHCKSLQCFKAHPSPWLLPTSLRQGQKKFQKCDSGSLGEEFYVCVYEIHQCVMHPPCVVYSQQSMKPVVWTWGVLTFHGQLCKRWLLSWAFYWDRLNSHSRPGFGDESLYPWAVIWEATS